MRRYYFVEWYVLKEDGQIKFGGATNINGFLLTEQGAKKAILDVVSDKQVVYSIKAEELV